MHRVPLAAQTERGPMKLLENMNRRQALGALGQAMAGLTAWLAAPRAESAPKTAGVSTPPPKEYDATAHRWQMVIDIDKCIGCGLCAQACKTENKVVPKPAYFRTWVERYIILKAEPGSGKARGETLVDSPNGGIDGFPPATMPKEKILKSFFVPKLCNHCENSPCDQACPVGATFRTPDGVVLVDPKYCLGCGFCVQTCPYGCRFINPITHTAEKCSLCYHRITRGLKPACVEACPTGARAFGDLDNPQQNDVIQAFIQKNKVQVLKPHLGTKPCVLYADLDKEVR